MSFGLVQMVLESLPERWRLGGLGHLRQGLYELVFCAVEISKLLDIELLKTVFLHFLLPPEFGSSRRGPRGLSKKPRRNTCHTSDALFRKTVSGRTQKKRSHRDLERQLRSRTLPLTAFAESQPVRQRNTLV